MLAMQSERKTFQILPWAVLRRITAMCSVSDALLSGLLHRQVKMLSRTNASLGGNAWLLSRGQLEYQQESGAWTKAQHQSVSLRTTENAAFSGPRCSLCVTSDSLLTSFHLAKDTVKAHFPCPVPHQGHNVLNVARNGEESPSVHNLTFCTSWRFAIVPDI